MQRHAMTEKVKHSRSTALERSVNIWEVGKLKSILHGHNPHPKFYHDVHKTSVHVTGLKLINTTSPRTYKSNKYKDETTIRTRQQEITEMVKQKKTNSGTRLEPEYQTNLKVLRPGQAPKTKAKDNQIQLTGHKKNRLQAELAKKGKGKVQGVPQSQAAALPRHQEEEETDKTKQAQIGQTYEKH